VHGPFGGDDQADAAIRAEPCAAFRVLRRAQPIYRGVAQVWFDDTNAMRESAKTTEYAAVRANEANFIEVSRLSFIITQERIIIGRTDDPKGRVAQRKRERREQVFLLTPSCASAQCSSVQLYSCASRPGETASCMTPRSPRSAGTPLPPTRLAHRRPIAGDVSMP